MSRLKTIGIGLLSLIVLCCVCVGGVNVADSLGLIPESTATNSPVATKKFTQELLVKTTEKPVDTPTIESIPTVPPTDIPTITPTANELRLPIVPNSPIPQIESASCIPQNAQIQKGVVVGVVDGDTIDVQLDDGNTFRLRYIGMDTPESGDICSTEATNINRAMVEGKPVLLAMDVSEVDRYDRLLRYVFVGDIFVNYELVIQGYAQQVNYPPDVACVDAFKEAQGIAKENGRGCWAVTPTFTLIPTSTPTPVPSQPPPPPPPPTEKPQGNCHPSYPDVCIPPPPPDLDCGDISYRRFRVVGSDPHRFDGDNDGIGCER